MSGLLYNKKTGLPQLYLSIAALILSLAGLNVAVGAIVFTPMVLSILIACGQVDRGGRVTTAVFQFICAAAALAWGVALFLLNFMEDDNHNDILFYWILIAGILSSVGWISTGIVTLRIRNYSDEELTVPLLGHPNAAIPPPPFEESELARNEQGADGQRQDDQGAIVQPGLHDVLLARANGVANHPGNMNFRHLIELHKFAYQLADRQCKSQILTNIIQATKESGGRFLSPVVDEGASANQNAAWRILDNSVVWEKTSIALLQAVHEQ